MDEMDTKTMEKKEVIESSEMDVKVVAEFKEDTACEFSIVVKSKHGGLYDMLRICAAYFASLEYYKDKNLVIDKFLEKNI